MYTVNSFRTHPSLDTGVTAPVQPPCSPCAAPMQSGSRHGSSLRHVGRAAACGRQERLQDGRLVDVGFGVSGTASCAALQQPVRDNGGAGGKVRDGIAPLMGGLFSTSCISTAALPCKGRPLSLRSASAAAQVTSPVQCLGPAPPWRWGRRARATCTPLSGQILQRCCRGSLAWLAQWPATAPHAHPTECCVGGVPPGVVATSTGLPALTGPAAAARNSGGFV